jgi:hypothetical protein
MCSKFLAASLNDLFLAFFRQIFFDFFHKGWEKVSIKHFTNNLSSKNIPDIS